MSTATFLVGDVRAMLATLPDNSVDLVMTSPPFLALRSYLPEGHPDKALEIGSEDGPLVVHRHHARADGRVPDRLGRASPRVGRSVDRQDSVLIG